MEQASQINDVNDLRLRHLVTVFGQAVTDHNDSLMVETSNAITSIQRNVIQQETNELLCKLIQSIEGSTQATNNATKSIEKLDESVFGAGIKTQTGISEFTQLLSMLQHN